MSRDEKFKSPSTPHIIFVIGPLEQGLKNPQQLCTYIILVLIAGLMECDKYLVRESSTCALGEHPDAGWLSLMIKRFRPSHVAP